MWKVKIFQSGKILETRLAKAGNEKENKRKKNKKFDKNIPVHIYHIEGVVFFNWCYCKEEQGKKRKIGLSKHEAKVFSCGWGNRAD